MGAADFTQVARGKTAGEARYNATEQACWDHGHAGYTGTMAEKSDHVMITVPEGLDPYKYADQLIQAGDERINDKWGPAGCIDLGPVPEGTGEHDYLFFGWASC